MTESSTAIPPVSNGALTDYFRRAAGDLFREPAGVLRHPFIVPGALYAQELWDWDSYWTTLGMLRLATQTGDAALRQQALRHGRGSLRNFFEHQHVSGGVPIMMRSDNADVFGCFEPGAPERNQAKPILGQFALALLQADASEETTALLADVLPKLARFHDRWNARYLHAPTGLLVWGSDVGVGVDNDPTVYGRPGFSSANLLLNCLYIEDLRAAATLALRLENHALASAWSTRADELAALVSSRCWDTRDRFFYTQDVQCGDHRAKLIPWAAPGMPMEWKSLPVRIQSFTGFLPLWCGAATPEQAEAMREHLLNPTTFHASFGVRALARNEPMFSLARSGNPSNWLGPIWIVASYFTWSGLRRYGFTAEATDLALRTLDLLERDLRSSGALHEYYHPDTGAPLMNKGFLSWNYLACDMLLREPDLARQFARQPSDSDAGTAKDRKAY